jgi:hypothetical protein
VLLCSLTTYEQTSEPFAAHSPPTWVDSSVILARIQFQLVAFGGRNIVPRGGEPANPQKTKTPGSLRW